MNVRTQSRQVRRTGVLAAAVLMAGAPSLAESQEAFQPFPPEAARVINSVDFSPDGSRMYLALLYADYLADRGLEMDGHPEIGLFESTWTDGQWTTPSPVSFSGTYPDYEPTLTADGSLMVFNSKRPYSDGRTPEINDLWFVERDAQGEWGEPRRALALTSFEYEESYGTLTADRRLVYLQGRPESTGQMQFDLFESRFTDGEFQAPVRHPVSTDRWGEGDPWIAPDGSYLIYTRWDESVGWQETTDLYIAFNGPGGWSTPVPLEQLNTDGPDYGAAVSPDGETLYYRAGGRFQQVPLRPLLDRLRP